MEAPRVVRVTVTIDPLDVWYLDRLAALTGTNRSQELRGILAQLRPALHSTVSAFEEAERARDRLSEAAAGATRAELEAMLPEVEKMQAAFLGAMSRLEGAATAAAADPRPSNHGGHTPTPPTEDLEQ